MKRAQQRKITRNRELRSCTECRRRKLRCDRQLPCIPCAKGDEAASCAYENAGGPSRQSQAEAKLEHLENIVQQLSTSSQTFTSSGPGLSSVNGVPSQMNELRKDSIHKGATHWTAMLEGIEELRSVIGGQDDTSDTNPDFIEYGGDDGISILFEVRNNLSFHDILESFLPSRPDADRLVAAYFRARAVAAPFVHATHFRRLYARFWENPYCASPLWVSILFSIFDIAARTMSMQSDANGGNKSNFDRFAIAAAHCLAIGHYYQPQRHTVDALLLFAQARCLTSIDISPTIGILFGTISRLATIMGYHRDQDASRVAESVFDREMRRRTWSPFTQLDMLVSFQLGLPTNVQFPTWDTKPPANLLDIDFDEDTMQLPPARPDSEPTELLFYIAKHRLMTVFEKVIRHTLSMSDRPDGELESIEQELRSTYTALPAVFRSRPMMESTVDAPSLIVARLCVLFIYHKSQCVLHRKYVKWGRQSSIQICRDSATQLVEMLLDIHEEFEPGGQLYTERWFMGSLSWHDFLLACTMLCLTTYHTLNNIPLSADGAYITVIESLELLNRAKMMCGTQSDRSLDSQKVHRLMETTLSRCNFQLSQDTVDTLPPPHNGENLMPNPSWQDFLSLYGDQDWLRNGNRFILTDDDPLPLERRSLDLPTFDGSSFGVPSGQSGESSRDSAESASLANYQPETMF